MAERRMFHNAVVGSDAFMELPAAAQALYFHLGMAADDDGFVNSPRQVARKLRRPPKDLGMLVDKGFLLDFDGVMVIRHWLVANSLKNDRMKPPQYPAIAEKLYIENNRCYTCDPEKGVQNLLENRRKMLDSKRNPKVREGKVREGKVMEGKIREDNIREDNISEDNAAVAACPAEPAAAAAADTQRGLNFLHGTLGKGVVLLSQAQVEELLEKMGLDCFDYYVEKLADYILEKQAKVKNHYATILKWWQEDGRV